MIVTQQVHYTEWHKNFVWEVNDICPFNELIISWNGRRTEVGTHIILVRIFNKEWSSWIPYGEWGEHSQKSFSNRIGNIIVYQDTLNIENETATGFQIKVESSRNLGAPVFEKFYAFTMNSDQLNTITHSTPFFKRQLSVLGLSQLALNDPRSQRICSATALTAVIRYLKRDNTLDPLDFSEGVWDNGFDIYGNWVFNVAHASEMLGNDWHCWVERFSSFDQILNRLEQNEPVIVSIKGILPGTIKPYNSGHLIAVIGYDSDNLEVTCMDPAYPKDEDTIVKYNLKDFLEVWGARKGLTYVLTRQVPQYLSY